MNVGIKKIANGLIPFFFHSFKGINGTVGTADVEENFHLNRHHYENLPLPLFACLKTGKGLPKRGIVPPFGKGRSGGILLINVAIIIRLLINQKSD